MFEALKQTVETMYAIEPHALSGWFRRLLKANQVEEAAETMKQLELIVGSALSTSKTSIVGHMVARLENESDQF